MRIVVCICLAMAVNFCLSPSVFALSIVSADNPVAQPAKTDNQFAFKLYSRLSLDKGNVFFSPYSLSSALEMVYEGAQGMTSSEMRTVLNLNTNDVQRKEQTTSFIKQINRADKPYQLSVANALWAQNTYPIKQGYLDVVKDVYSAQARNLDFALDPEVSRKIINAWVSDETKDRINELLPVHSIDPTACLVLTDAVYFKGKWDIPFKKDMTQAGDFWITPDQSVRTDMMSVLDSFDYFENDQVQVLQLPYQGGELSMFIILPRSNDIKGLEKILTQDTFSTWQEGLGPQNVNVTLPKFKFDSGHEMSSILRAMGMKLAFDTDNADFSGIADKVSGKSLHISGVFDKAWIDTDEEGTEAAAATAVVSNMPTAAYPGPNETKDFVADHPFIFLIKDIETGKILFMGRVSDPREE